MNFKVKKISKRRKKTLGEKILTYLKQNQQIKIILVVLFLFTGGSLAYNTLHQAKENPVTQIFKTSPLKADKFGHTNILILGVGGDLEEGGNLSDSLMIASISQKEKGLSLLSIPRDLFVSSKVGERKMNEVYAAAKYKYGEETGLNIAKEAIKDFTNIDIHYGAVVNFRLFSDIVDIIGGVEIFVPTAINDPYYPAANYQYQTFTVRQGLQTMDGETALKYARSRKTSSDYSRAQRQQDLLLAIKNKVEKQGVLTSLSKLKELYEIIKKRTNTDLTIKELGLIAKHAQGLEYENVISSVLNDDPSQKGGILYTPAKEFYGGQFVLLPADKKEANSFFRLTIKEPQILKENAQISILNGSKETGKANKLSKKLRQLGFHVIETGNYKSDRALLKHRLNILSNNAPKSTLFLKELLNVSDENMKNTEVTDKNNVLDIQIILGTDEI